MNRNRIQEFFIRSGRHRPLALACAAGLLTLGLVSGVWAGSVPTGVIGGQGGATGRSLGGAAGNGGQGGGIGGAVGLVGTAGNGGGGGASINGGSGGGSGGTVGLHATVSSTVTGAIGSAGSPGGYSHSYYFSGGGGGGGGDGVYSAAGITITNQASSTITGGAGGHGGDTSDHYGGSGGGGGNGIEFAGTGAALVNQGVIKAGAGGRGGNTYSGGALGPSGSGGGHGVVGAGITITNSGTIAGGAAGGFADDPKGATGTAGDAILFTGGNNNPVGNTLNLLAGSTISGAIEAAGDSLVYVNPLDAGLTLSSSIVSSGGGFCFCNMAHPLTVSGVINGAGETVSVSNDSTLTFGNIDITGISPSGSVYTNGGGYLQLDGEVKIVGGIGGVLSGVGTAGAIYGSNMETAPGEPGHMFGVLSSNGAAQLGQLAIRSTDGTACSALHASGALTLAADASGLIIHFENTPKIGATCTIATGSSVSGTFAKVVSTPATVTVSYNSNSITFIVTGNSDSIFADGFDGGTL